MKKVILFLLGVLFLSGCQVANNVTTVNSNVKGMVYNNIATKYTPKLTVVKLSEFSGGDEYLTYSVESYKYSNGVFQSVTYSIPKSFIKEHKELLNKFLTWDAQAKDRGDQLTKEIGRAKTYNGYSVFSFHSANKFNNVLTICFSMTDTPGCSVDEVAFDVDNVKLIINDVNKFESGKFSQLDTSIYN